MPVESDADRAAFFDTDEFANAGLWTLAAGGAPWSVPVILDREHQIVDVGEGPGVQQEIPMARCRAVDLPTGYGKGDTLEVGFDSWTVERVDLDIERAVATVILRV